jgi:thioredoxin-like negative regulator of GroEL
VPTVVSLFNGKTLGSFMGTISDNAFSEFVTKVLRAGGADASQSIITEAEALLEQGNIPGAAKAYNQLLLDPSLGQVVVGLAGLSAYFPSVLSRTFAFLTSSWHACCSPMRNQRR